MPSVRAVWLARRTSMTCGRKPSRFNALGAGGGFGRWHRDWHRDWDWQVSMPSVRAVWLARRNWLLVDLRSRRFNALGAGGVVSVRISSRELPVAGILVSMPSVRAVLGLRASLQLRTVREVVAEFQCPRCRRCGSRGQIQRAAWRGQPGSAGFQCPRCGRCDSLALLNKSWNETWHEVSMPSVRAVWLARRSSGMCTTRDEPGFSNALGAGRC